MEAPFLSVVVSVYNHERYIAECLKSIAAQKTSFPMEVIVGEDCSTDGTRAVLRELESELPDYFTILYRSSNMGAVANGEDLYTCAKGKYLVDFEGDDYLLHEYKFQEQVDFLEAHPEYSAVFTNCLVVGADSRPNGEGYPECHEDEYSFHEFFLSCLPGHCGTLVCRREEYLQARNRFMSLKQFDFYPGDRRNAFLFLTMGKVRCFQEQWSAYRHVVEGGSSYSANLKKDRRFAENEVGFGKTLVAYALQTDNAEAVAIAKQTCYRFRFKWCHGKSKVEPLLTVLGDLWREDHRLSLLLAPFKWYVGLAFRLLGGKTIV